MSHIPWTVIAVATALACADGGASPPREPVIGGPCENCEMVFEGMPAAPSWSARIAPEDEPGEPMRIDGVVRNRAGEPVAGVIVYAYHTDHRGYYPRAENQHGRLRGWARTDEEGRYRFDTIRPAGYPDTRLPQHVHMHIIEPGRGTYWIGDINFDDDPRMTAALRQAHATNRGGNGLATPVRRDGGWFVTRDIVLGENVSGYPD
jgi:protocatechuate 3,4-dioxygenase beta subunit